LAKTKVAYQGEDKKIPNKLAIDFFIKGLRPDIRRAVRRLPDPPDFETALANAEKEQRILEQEYREEKEILESINSLVLDQKVEELTEQVNSLQQVNRNRPKSPAQERPRAIVRFQSNARPNQNYRQRSATPFRPRTQINPPRQLRFVPRRIFPNPRFWSRRPRNVPFRFFNQPYVPYPPYAQPIPYVAPNQAAGPAIANAPQYYQTSSRFPSTAQNVNFLCILAIIAACLINPIVAFQICGSSSFPNVLSLPKQVQCTATTEEPMIETNIQLFGETSKPLQLTAHKCYRDVIKVSVHNFLYIRTRRTVIGRQRISISKEDCELAKTTNTIHGHPLVEVSPGLKITREIEDENSSLPLWGTNLYLRSLYSIEEGQIASFNGETMLSTLGNLNNCTISDGVCLTPNEVIIWEPIEVVPWCRYTSIGNFDALVSMKFILILEHELAFEFSNDHLLRTQLLRHCSITNSYLTTSNHLISFPNIPPNTMVQDFILETSYNFKRKREVKYLTDAENRQSRYELVPAQTLPIARRIFGSDIQSLPAFETQPITHILLLREIKLWNITNADFLRRSRMYLFEDIRTNVLRTIRYAEYRYRQISWLRSIETKRPLNYAETALLQDLEHGITDVFDEYLSKEFGTIGMDIDQDPARLKAKPAPFFQPEDLKKVNVTNQIEADPYAQAERERERLKSSTSTSTALPPKVTTTAPTTTSTTASTTLKATQPTAKYTTTTSSAITMPFVTRPPVVIPPYVHIIPESKSLNPISPFTTSQRTTIASTPTTTTTSTTKMSTTQSRPTTTTKATTTTATSTRPPVKRTTTSIIQTITPRIPTTTSPSSTTPIKAVLTFEKLIPLPPSEYHNPPLHRQFKRTNSASSNSADYQLSSVNIRREFNNICVRQFLNNQRLHELSRADPTWAARILLGTSDVVATLTDDELLVSRCRKVEPTEVYSNHQVNQTCYDLLPVLVEDQLWFAVPGTGDLVQSSTEIPCPYITNVNGQVQPMLPPNVLLSDNVQPFLFKSPPIYHHIMQNYAPTIRHQIDALQHEYAAMQNRLQRRGILDDTLLKIKDVKNSIGESLSSIYDKTTTKLTDGIENIRWSLISLLLWITIPALAGIILVAICICCVKLYFIRTASNTAASAMFEMASNLSKRRRVRTQPAVNSLLIELPPQEPLFVPRIYAIPFATNHVQNPLPYVRIALNQFSTPALVDSGATISYMRQSTLYALGPHLKIDEHHVKAQAANGSHIALSASVTVNVNIGTHTIPHRFLVSQDNQCPAPVLLGTDFIKKLNQLGLKVTIDLHNNLLTIGSDAHNMIQINAINFLEVKPYDVRLLHTTILPKRSSSIVPALIDNHSADNPFDFLIEDNQRDIDLLYVVGRSLVHPSNDGICLINILNPSCTDIRLYERMRVAFATPVSSPMEQILAVQSEYIPPEANWEERIPHFPIQPAIGYDIAKEIDLTKSALTTNQKEQLITIIRHHAQAFVGPDGHLGHYNGPIRHRIDLVDNAPIPTRKIYRVPLEKRTEIEQQITQMLKDGIIRESASPFCAPIVLVRKRDANSWRFTIDFRGLNAITKPQQSILPNIQDIIDLCANNCLYSSLDFQQGFHQIPLEESHCERTA
ncbi:unnamed protein product, partial [Cylicostephanus goldi]